MPADPLGDDASGAIDVRAARRHFSRAAATYDSAAVLQREVSRRMAERLDVVKLSPSAMLDAGCGTGEALAELALRYPAARQIALDIALPMLRVASAKTGQRRSTLSRLFSAFTGGDPAACNFVCGDIGTLPFASGAFDLVWSNLALQWAADLPRALGELGRVLRVGGLVSFSTFGPDTLRELRSAFAGVDRHTHVSRFADMHDVGDMLVAAGFGDPVMDMELFTLTYPDSSTLLHDLKAIGATNATRARSRGLMGRRRFERALETLETTRRDGRIPATFEVIYGHAWKVAPRRTPEGHAIVAFPGRG